MIKTYSELDYTQGEREKRGEKKKKEEDKKRE